jgi:cell wall-associated NlpC family hydrolase
VTKWQKRHHVAQTGAVDAATWAALPIAVRQTACSQQVHGSGAAATCAHLSSGSSGPAVEVLQNALKLTADGAFGPQTLAAVKSAQTKAKLTASGVVGVATWAALGLTGTPVCVAEAKHKLTADEKAQRQIRAEVVQLAAELLDQTGVSKDPVALQALAFAHKQKGKPYQWGGTGPKSYDCSGLVMASYLHAGITLPRVAADQYAAGPTVPLNEAQQGDLLFYASDVSKPSTIYHVVIYDGGGQIFDAPYTGAFVGTRPLWTTNLLPVAVRPTAQLKLPVTVGSTGWTVAQLQQLLDRHGASLPVTGGYGPQTQSAVESWKTAHGFKATPHVGRTVWLQLSWWKYAKPVTAKPAKPTKKP